MLIRLLRQLLAGVPRRDNAPAADAAQRARAVALHRSGQLAEAAAAYRSILAQNPHDAAMLGLLGHCLTLQGDHDAAVELLLQAAAIDAGAAAIRFNLAVAYKAKGAYALALDSLNAALRLHPAFVEAHVNAAEVARLSGDYDCAEAHFRAALAIDPRHAEAHYNFGIHFHNLGQPLEAIACFRRAIEVKPDFALAHGNLVAVASAAPGYNAVAILDEQRAWAHRFADPLTPPAPRYANAADGRRRLRVGYVSPDLWQHPITNFFEPLLERHDRAAFEVICYDTAKINDAVNQRLRARADGWVDCAALDEVALTQRIRDDRIDILVDLSAHTKNNRLPVFARKPAPVQVSYLGYPTSTGMAAIDYRLSDSVLDPDGFDCYSAEQVVRLPGTYFCFRPPPALPPVGPLPAAARGHLTFGSFNNLAKLNAPTVARWAQVLNALPDSKLFLKTKSLADAQIQCRVAAAFAAHGIAESRLLMRGWEVQTRHHLDHYNEVDIALDPAPYNGVTTTCEALLMGVPVVVLRGDTHLSRMGASLLVAAGLPELIVATPEEYLQKCLSLAGDPSALATLRAQLRGRVAASALMDEAGFTRALEREYRSMWLTWCRRQA
jgi:predicted O-linked N-acetylglucosamine transferase (SPINDLY family)